MKKIVYIGDFKFSKFNAECELVLGNAYLFEKLGYEVAFIGNDTSRCNGILCYDQYKNFKVYNLKYTKTYKDILNIFSLHTELIEILTVEQPQIVVCYGSLSLSLHLQLIKSYCKKKKITFLVNCVDLPIINNGNIISKTIRRIDRLYRNHIYKNADGLIAVSEYISMALKNKNLPSVVIPPIRNITEEKQIENYSGVVKLMYAGIPFPLDGRKIERGNYKDRLDVVIDTLYKLEKKGLKFVFDIYGLTNIEYTRVVKKQINIIRDTKNIFFHGHVSKEKCDEELYNHDFMILIRDVNRTSLAGFSTKVVDSIMSGIPVILNPVGDVSKYLVHNYNCMIIQYDNEHIDESELEEILKQPREKITELKKNCIEDKPFDVSNYVNKMRQFLETYGGI